MPTHRQGLLSACRIPSSWTEEAAFLPGLKNNLDEYGVLSFGASITLALCLVIFLLSYLYIYVEGRGGYIDRGWHWGRSWWVSD